MVLQKTAITQPMYKAILFDLDDTLLNFRASEIHSLGHVHRTLLQTHVEFDAFLATFRKVNKVLWRDLEKAQVTPQEIKVLRFERSFSAFTLPLDHVVAANAYEEALSQSAIWFEGVKERLESLALSHRIGIITNGISIIQRGRLERAGLNQLAHSIVVSEEVGIAKPDKRIFAKALEELDAAPRECLMVGDTLTSDYIGAQNVGMNFCWVNAPGMPLPSGFAKPAMQVASVKDLLV